MSDFQTQVSLSADAGPLEAGMHQGSSAVAEAVAQMREKMMGLEEATRENIAHITEGFKGMQETINGAFEKVQSTMVALTAAMAGAGAIKEFVSDAMSVTKEAISMGRALGVSATDASYLKVALSAVGVSSEEYMAAASRITRTLATNEEAFKDLGVATRDGNGNLLSTREILDATNERLRDFAEGTDRNVEGMKIYGRAWSEIAPMVAKFRGETEETRAEAEELNLVVGQEAVDALKAYKVAHIGAGEVMEGISNTIGQALMPRLTNLANWFKSIGPEAVEITRIAMTAYLSVQDAVMASVSALWDTVREAFAQIGQSITAVFGDGGEGITAFEFFENAVKVVQVAFIGLRVGVQEAANLITGTLRQLGNEARMVGSIVTAALHGDWDGVKAAWAKGEADTTANLQKTMDDAVAIATKGQQDIDNTLLANLGQKATVTRVKDKTGGERSDGGVDKTKEAKSRVAEWEAALREAEMAISEVTMAQGQFFELSTEQEKAYWQQMLQLTKAGSEENVAVRTKIAELTKKAMTEQYEAEMAGLRAGEQAARNNLEAKMIYAQRELEITTQLYGQQSKQATEAAAHIEEVQRQQIAQARELSDLRVAAAREGELADIDTQERATKAAYELKKINFDQMIALEQAFEQRRNDIRMKAIQDEMKLIDPQSDPVQYQKLLNQIEALQVQHNAKMQELQIEVTKNSQASWMEMFKGIDQQFGSLLLQVAQGTLKMRTFFFDLAKDILDALTKSFINMGIQWATTQAQSLATSIATNLGIAQSAAGVAGANATASTAAAPWPINMTAPAVGAEMMSVAEGFAATASAAGGYDIPSGVNPVTQLHAREMVLPAQHADTIRGLAGGGGGTQVHFNVSAMDTKSFEGFLGNGGGAVIEKMIRQALRNGAR